MIRYSGGTIINTTSTPTTRGALCNLITQALSDAGWTTISGTPGSSADVTMGTAAGNQGQKVRVRVFDPATGNCVQLTLKHSSGSPTSSICYVLPASVLWRVIANKFHFFAFQSGSGARISPRAAVFGGIVYVESFLPLSAGDGAGFIQGTGTSDTDVTSHSSWRNNLRSYDTTNAGGAFSGLWVATMMNTSSWSSQAGAPSILVWQGGHQDLSGNAYRWEDGSALAYEPLVCWGTTGSAEDARVKGQLYDAVVVSGIRPGESTINFDGHNWMSITDVPTASTAANSQLYLAIS